MPTVYLPEPLRAFTDGRATIQIEGSDLRSVLADLASKHPEVGSRIMNGEKSIRKYISVFVDEKDVRTLAGLETEVKPRSKIVILSALAGG